MGGKERGEGMEGRKWRTRLRKDKRGREKKMVNGGWNIKKINKRGRGTLQGERKRGNKGRSKIRLELQERRKDERKKEDKLRRTEKKVKLLNKGGTEETRNGLKEQEDQSKGVIKEEDKGKKVEYEQRKERRGKHTREKQERGKEQREEIGQIREGRKGRQGERGARENV